MAAMLLKLPPEILKVAIEKLSVSDLKAVCRVSRALHLLAIPYLYESVVIQVDIDGIPLIRHFKLFLANEKYFDFTKTVVFERQPCNPSNKMRRRRPGRTRDEHGLELLPFLKLFKDDSLRKFVWNLRMWFPTWLFGESEFLSKHQRCITQIALITNPTSPCFDTNEEPIFPIHWKELDSISWKGVRFEQDFGGICRYIYRSRNSLKSLELGISSWCLPKNSLSPSNGIPETNFVLPYLESLSLSRTKFLGKTLRNAINLCNLRSLKLWNSPIGSELLEFLSESNSRLRLTTLELFAFSFHPDDDHLYYWCDSTVQSLIQFLRSFVGLTNLYVMLSDDSGYEDLFYAINHHGESLRRLVIHTRNISMDVDPEESIGHDADTVTQLVSKNVLDYTKLDCLGISGDCENLMFHMRSLNPKPQCRILHIRSSKGFDEVGTQWGTAGLRPYYHSEQNRLLEQFPDDYTEAWDLIAFTRAKFYRLAQWAFGENGLPNLKIMVYGDLSHGDRYIDSQIILCRDLDLTEGMDSTISHCVLQRNDTFMQDRVRRKIDYPVYISGPRPHDEVEGEGKEEKLGLSYRILQRSDFRLQDLLHNNLDMLSVCPVDEY